MKRAIALMLIVAIFCGLLVVCSGCADTSDENQTVTRCVKCGGVATTTFYGPADTMQRNGIPIDACELAYSNMYAAAVCIPCMGYVAEITPDP